MQGKNYVISLLHVSMIGIIFVCVCVCVCVLSCLINLYCGRRKKMLSCHHRIFLLDPVASEHAPEALLVDGRPSNLRVPLLQRYYCVQLC